MATISVRITENIQVGLRKLGVAIPTVTDAEFQAGLEAATKEARGGWPGGGNGGYSVPLRLGQTYARTGGLGAASSWHKEGKSYRFESNAYSVKGEPYSVGVLGDGHGNGQWGVHQGRWPVAYQIMLKWAKTITTNIQSKLNTVMAEIR